MEIYVEPITIVSTTQVDKIAITIDEIQLFSHVKFRIVYYDQDGFVFTHPTLTNTLVISKEEYAEWGEDDQYILHTVMEKLNLVSIPHPPTPPPSPTIITYSPP